MPAGRVCDQVSGLTAPGHMCRSVAQLPSSEVLVTFGTSFLTRFGKVDVHQASGDEAFGGTAWRRVHHLSASEKKPFLVSTYRDSLKTAGFRYVVSFEMYDEQGNDLHLVFGTRSHRALKR